MAKTLRVVIRPRSLDLERDRQSFSLNSDDLFEIHDSVSAGERADSASGRSERTSERDPRLDPQLARFLRRVPGLAGLSPEGMRLLVDLAGMLDYESNEIIAKTVRDKHTTLLL
jgi:hypothetical protein